MAHDSEKSSDGQNCSEWSRQGPVSDEPVLRRVFGSLWWPSLNTTQSSLVRATRGTVVRDQRWRAMWHVQLHTHVSRVLFWKLRNPKDENKPPYEGVQNTSFLTMGKDKILFQGNFVPEFIFTKQNDRSDLWPKQILILPIDHNSWIKK